MNSTKNMAVIGAFVVGAMALAIVALLVLGGGKFFEKKTMVVMYFDGSVKGLKPGSPVVFRGVNVGEVDHIAIRTNPDNWNVEIPVYVKLNSESWGVDSWRNDAHKEIQHAVDLGLRARLDLESFVTGQMQVTLDLKPDIDPVILGKDARYPEIPTIPSGMEMIAKTLKELPLQEIFESLSDALENINELVGNPELDEIVHNVNEMTDDAKEMLERMDAEVVDPVSKAVKHGDELVVTFNEHIGPLLEDARKTLESADKLVAHVDEELVGKTAATIESSRAVLDEVRGTIEVLEKALANVETMTRRDSEEREKVNKLLEELSAAARSIRNATDYLERHPESVIRGKGRPN